MSRNDGKTERYAKDAKVSRRKFLTAAAVSAGGVSTLSFSILAKAASSTADNAGGTGVVAEIAREEALTFGKNRYMGAPVAMAKAPNGAITNKELLGRIGDFN